MNGLKRPAIPAFVLLEVGYYCNPGTLDRTGTIGPATDRNGEYPADMSGYYYYSSRPQLYIK